MPDTERRDLRPTPGEVGIAEACTMVARRTLLSMLDDTAVPPPRLLIARWPVNLFGSMIVLPLVTAALTKLICGSLLATVSMSSRVRTAPQPSLAR